jgi:hypothetical protein
MRKAGGTIIAHPLLRSRATGPGNNYGQQNRDPADKALDKKSRSISVGVK